MTQISNEMSRAIKPSPENKNIDDEAYRLTDPAEVSFLISKFLVDRAIDRILRLCGGHILPIWNHAAPRLGIRIIDVRDKRSAGI